MREIGNTKILHEATLDLEQRNLSQKERKSNSEPESNILREQLLTINHLINTNFYFIMAVKASKKDVRLNFFYSIGAAIVIAGALGLALY